MPVTFAAHQVPALALKVWKPHRVDAIAMCVGSMAPDLLYAVSDALDIDPHRWPTAMLLGVPLTLLIAWAIRSLIAPELCPALPDLGQFRLRSYAVVSHRRPRFVQSLGSAIVGIGSHIVVDEFTHTRRFGPSVLGYEDVTVTVLGVTRPLAGAFQWFGHLVGSAIAILLLLRISRQRLLEQWYGDNEVAAARSRHASRLHQVRMWVGVVAGAAIGIRWGWQAERIEVIQRFAIGVGFGLTVAAATSLVCARVRS